MKNLFYFFSVIVVAFQIAFVPTEIKAQSIKDFKGGIGGGSEIQTDDSSSNDLIYVGAGVLVLAGALYYYLKWYKKKRGKVESKKVETSQSELDEIISLAQKLPLKLNFGVSENQYLKQEEYKFNLKYQF